MRNADGRGPSRTREDVSATCIQLPFGCAASCLRGAPSARDAPTHTRCLWCTHAGALLEREIELGKFKQIILDFRANSQYGIISGGSVGSKAASLHGRVSKHEVLQ